MPDVTKLPKWAQQELKVKDQYITHLQKTIDGMVGSDANGSDITYDREMGGEGKPLPTNTSVRFKTGKNYHEFLDVRLQRDSNNQTYVQMHSSEPLTLRPNGSNVIHVYPTSRN